MRGITRTLRELLNDILTAIELIDEYTDEMILQEFRENVMVQDAVNRRFEIIGEASNLLMKDYPEFVASHPHLKFTSAYSMRNVISHAYLQIDLDLVWETMEIQLPELYHGIQKVLDEMPQGPAPSVTEG